MRRFFILFLLPGLGTCTGGTAGSPADSEEERVLATAAFGGPEEEPDIDQPMFGGQAEEAPEDTLDIGVDPGGQWLDRYRARYGDAGVDVRGLARPKDEIRTWQRSGLVPNTSRLAVGDNEELPLRAMQATVRVDGFRARVVLDCVYENDRDEQLEGNFQLRLPNDASPFSLAFGETRPKALPEATDALSIGAAHPDTWAAAPKEARIVPRERAARAYRDVVRKQVDPALLEWSGAGVFSARVFPLLPGKFHRIVVGYEVDLLPVGDDLEYRLDLPGKIPSLLVDITVPKLAHTVDPATPAVEGRHVYENPVERTFTVRLTKPGNLILLGKDPAAGDLFAAFARPELEATSAATSTSATFLVDMSASSDPAIWLKLLEAILERNRPSLREFNVVFFNIEAFWWRDARQANTPENVARLLADARALTPEGATDLGLALETAAREPEEEWDEVPAPSDLFLLSDGAATWGESDRHAIAKRIEGRALYAYATGLSGADPAMLALLARETGGAVFSVVGEAEIDAAATAHTIRPWHIEKAGMEGTTDILLAGRPTSIFPGQTLLLAGRGRPPGPLSLTLRRGDALRTVQVPLRTLDSDLAASAYGRIAVAQLEEIEAPEARSYALHFGVVGATCSLLMLEAEEDYEAYGIVPGDDAKTVREQAAADIVARELGAAATRLGDPKAAFLAWLDRLRSTPGVELDLPAQVRAAAERLPREAFDVRPERLSCACRDGVARKDYDEATAEALRRREKHGAADALKALSSLVEQNPGDAVLARDVGYSAMEWGLGGEAYHLFRRVAQARPYEPLGFHTMALCLADAGKPDLALLCYEVVRAGKWDGRYGDLRRILDLEYLRFLRGAAEDPRCLDREHARTRLGEVAEATAPRVADLVVVIAWNTDGTDVDLHVTDPRGEECFYSHPETAIGGRLTADVTQGYGPEMFVLERAVKGAYAVRAKYFSSDRSRASARTKVYATVYEDWGRPSERMTRKVVTLAEGKEMHDLARVVKP